MQLNSDLENIQLFASEHNLKLNASKSSVIFFNKKKINVVATINDFTLSINNVNLSVVNDIRNLGVYLDTNLTFQFHIKYKQKIAYMRLKKLYHLRKFLPAKTKYYLCNLLILSLFDYRRIW